MTASAIARAGGPALPAAIPRAKSGILEVLPVVGDVVDRYRMLRLVSKDALTTLFHAKHEMLEIEVAFRILMIDGEEAERFSERLRRGLLALERVDRRAGVVRIRANGIVGARRFPYVATDLVAGTDLAKLLRSGPLPPARAFELCEKVARALAACHQQGLTHRALAPSCILIREPGGEPLVSDLCLVHDEARERLARTFELPDAAYLAPESVRGRAAELDPAADVYGLGAILYECLTGEAPFVSPSPALLVNKVLTEDPVDPSKKRPGVPPDAGLVARKCLAKAKEQRYATALEAADELARLRAGQPVLARAGSMLGSWNKKPRGR